MRALAWRAPAEPNQVAALDLHLLISGLELVVGHRQPFFARRHLDLHLLLLNHRSV
jgi:hypothetical protein